MIELREVTDSEYRFQKTTAFPCKNIPGTVACRT